MWKHITNIAFLTLTLIIFILFLVSLTLLLALFADTQGLTNSPPTGVAAIGPAFELVLLSATTGLLGTVLLTLYRWVHKKT